jgi:predicted dehydrogenase
MTVEATVWRVGIIGINSAGLYLLERLSLTPNIRIVGAFDPDPARRGLADHFGCALWKELPSTLAALETDVLFFAGEISTNVISMVLGNGQHVVLHEPWRLSSDVLFDLSKSATTTNRVATVSCIRRWSADFVGAMTANNSGRLGTLQTVRFSSCEQGIPLDNSSAGMLREFGYHWLDQLLILIDSAPVRVFARRFFEDGETYDHGVWATIEFANGCLAQIDLQSRSRLSHRTGWMLEGSTGSYRNDRLYTTTAEGEIVDEPLPHSERPADPLIDELKLAWQGETTKLPTLANAARVVKLIEAIEQSAELCEVIRL